MRWNSTISGSMALIQQRPAGHRRHQAATGGNPGVKNSCCYAHRVTLQVAQRGPGVDSRLDTAKKSSNRRVDADRPRLLAVLRDVVAR